MAGNIKRSDIDRMIWRINNECDLVQSARPYELDKDINGYRLVRNGRELSPRLKGKAFLTFLEAFFAGIDAGKIAAYTECYCTTLDVGGNTKRGDLIRRDIGKLAGIE